MYQKNLQECIGNSLDLGEFNKVVGYKFRIQTVAFLYDSNKQLENYIKIWFILTQSCKTYRNKYKREKDVCTEKIQSIAKRNKKELKK